MTQETGLPELPRTGHHDIDAVHRRLAQNIASLWAALDHGDREQAMTCILALLDCLRADYACEESLMGASDYPGATRHHNDHAGLEVAFNGIARRIRNADCDLGNGERSALRIALSQVAVELAGHVLGADMALARYLDGKGSSTKGP